VTGFAPAAFAADAIADLNATTGWSFGVYARAKPPRVETRGRGCGTGLHDTLNVIGFITRT
jgi:hypothetical protein